MKQIQFITYQTDDLSHSDSAKLALESGIRWIQLRMKHTPLDVVLAEAEKIKALCATFQAKFLMNDFVEIAQQVKADGVHLGKSDLPVTKAREILGEQAIIGGTANTLDDIRLLAQTSANYIGLGPFRFTTTKEILSPLLGLDGYREAIKTCRQEGILLPIYAIGGITLSDISAIKKTGVFGVAVSSLLSAANDPIQSGKELVVLWKTSNII